MKIHRRLLFLTFMTLTLATSGCAQNTSTPVTFRQENVATLAAQNARIREVGEAMQGGGWNVYGNGFLGDWFQASGGEIEINIRAAGDPSANIYPLMRVWVNEKMMREFSVASTEYKDYALSTLVPKGITRIEIEFINDTNGETPDRNLRVMEIAVSNAKLSEHIPKIGEVEIAKHRMGDLIVRGKPGTKVHVKQLRHEFPFGTCIAHEVFLPLPENAPSTAVEDRKKYLEIARTWFNAATPENSLKWYHTEKKQGEVSYEDADRVLAWAKKNEIQVRGHTLFWAVDQYVQDWVKGLDDATLKAKIKARIDDIVPRYKGRIDEWDVNNEMLHGDYYGQRLGAQINADMFILAKAANPNAVLYVNDYAVLSGPNAGKYFEQVQQLKKMGAPVGGVGFQGHFGYGIDLRHVKCTLDKFAELKLPLKVTEFDLKTGNPQDKAKQMADFYRTCFAHPSIEGITMWGFWQGSDWIPEAAIFAKDWTPTPAAMAYHELVFKEWWTDTQAVIPASGVLRLRAFYGRHQVVCGDRKKVVELKKNEQRAEAAL